MHDAASNVDLSPLPPVDADRGPQLPADLRAGLRDALVASFGSVSDDVDLDMLGFELLEGVGELVAMRARDIHRSRSVHS